MANSICSAMRLLAAFLAMTLLLSCVVAVSAEKEVPPAPKHDLSIENILRWPLEGAAGADRVISLLLKTGKFEKIIGVQYWSKESFTLSDDFGVRKIWIIPSVRKIDISLNSDPCLSVQQAKAFSKAGKEPFFPSSHGEPAGDMYSVEAERMLVRFTTSLDFKCVENINILELSEGVQDANIRRQQSLSGESLDQENGD